jgi:hypothetical protein
MDEAIYTAYLTGVLTLSEHGVWHHEGVPFSNQKLSSLFHRSIVWSPTEKSYVVRIGKGQATFTCEDTAYFVSGLNTDAKPWEITLADGAVEELDAHSLHTGEHHQIYCTVKNGHRARFMRNVHQQLLEYAVDESTILVDGKRVLLGSKSKSK